MTIAVACPCGKQFKVDDALAGRRIICKSCRQALIIPSPSKKDNTALPPGKRPEEEIGIAPIEEAVDEVEVVTEEESGPASYTLNPQDARLGARLRGAPVAGEDPRLAGELGCFRLSGPEDAVTCLACSPDNRHALAAVAETVFILDYRDGRIVTRFQKQERRVRCLAVSPDGRYALSGDNDGGLLLWEVGTGRALRWLEGHRGKVEAVTFGPGGHFALSGGEDGRVLFWDLHRGELVVCLEESARTVTAVAFSPDGRLALTGDGGGHVRLWDVASGRWLANLQGISLGPIGCLTFTADGAFILAGGRVKVLTGAPSIGRWDVRTGRYLRCFIVPTDDQTTIRGVAFSPDGRRALVGGAMNFAKPREGFNYDYEAESKTVTTPVRLWDLESGQILKSFEGHEKIRAAMAGVQDVPAVHCVAFTPDARRALSGGNDGTVRVWGLPQ